MQQRHTTDVRHPAQRIAPQVDGFEPDEVAQRVRGLYRQFDPIVAQVQRDQRLHATYCSWQAGQAIVVHVQGTQSWEMLDKPGMGIGQSGISQIQLGDMLKIGLQPGHRFQMPPHGHVA
ncbi:hypothetical protein D3C73_1380950 [compost metagenome]